MESEVHASVHLNCHHQITYARFNVKIHYPPPYEREIWHYDQEIVDHIRKAVDLFAWQKAVRSSARTIWFFYLTKRLRIFFVIVFLMKQLHLLIETLRQKCPNTEFLLVSPCICTRKNSVFGYFSRSEMHEMYKYVTRPQSI